MKKNFIKQISMATVFAAALTAVGCGESQTEQQVPTATVSRGVFYVDLYEEGELAAVNAVSINSPTISWRYGNPKITQIVKEGTEVHPGDTLILFDPTEVNKGVEEAQRSLEVSNMELAKMRVQHQSDLDGLNADLEVAEIAYEISNIQFEQAEYESEIRKRELKLSLEKAGISLERAREQIDNRKRTQNEELRQKMLSMEQYKMRLNEAFETLNRLVAISPYTGIALIENNWSTGNKYQMGDQVYSGNMIIQLPDMSKLKATINVNEVDIAKVQKGLKVEIRPDALSDKVFLGTIVSVANLAINKDYESRVKVFPVQIVLDETDPSLLPGLTVSCRILVSKLDDVLSVPLTALHFDDDGEYVYRKSGGRFDKVYVESGARNSDYVVIVSGIDEKDEVAIADPYASQKSETEEPDTESEEPIQE